MVEGRVVYRVLVGKPDGKRPLGRPRRRWEVNVRMDRQEVGCNFVRVIKTRRLRWAGNVARMVEERVVYRVLVGKPE
jgi:hypothetical protein